MRLRGGHTDLGGSVKLAIWFVYPRTYHEVSVLRMGGSLFLCQSHKVLNLLSQNLRSRGTKGILAYPRVFCDDGQPCLAGNSAQVQVCSRKPHRHVTRSKGLQLPSVSIGNSATECTMNVRLHLTQSEVDIRNVRKPGCPAAPSRLAA